MYEEADEEAMRLHDYYITQTGFTLPSTYADLLLFVELSGGMVAFHQEAPEDFYGLQMGEWIIVGGGARRTDRELMLILAHEWCHWLRRQDAEGLHFRLYEVSDDAAERDREEKIARAFERMF